MKSASPYLYEHRSQPLLPRAQFMRRLLRSAGTGFALIAVSLLAGMLGYHLLEQLSWVDAFLNSAMLLGGMGPVGDLPNDQSKLFAALFALYSGLVFILLAGLMLAPVFHRVLHHFHWEEK